MNHNRRNSIKVSIGIASSIEDTVPEYVIDFPVFNFQGGVNYMQGGSDSEENKNIEFGLDITPLLGMLETGNDNKFFLVIEERDPDSLGHGFIREFAVIDYTANMPVESSTGFDSIPIDHNAKSYIPLVFSEELDIMRIVTDDLPDGIIGEAYYTELQAEGGLSPINWELLQAVKETDTVAETDTTGTSMEPGHWLYGNIAYELPFPFTYYGLEYDSIFIHPAGFVMFENTYNPWPYLVDPDLFLRSNRCIAPLLCRYTEYDTSSGDGIWVDDRAEFVKICWRNRSIYPGYKPQLEFTLELHDDGKIIFVYGNDLEGYRLPWTCGISEGDGFSAYFPEVSGRNHIMEGEAVMLELLALPAGITFSTDGVLSGIPAEYFDGELLFSAKDMDHKRSYRSLHFSASGLGIDETDDDLSLEVYPNPSTGIISFRYSISDIRYSIFELYSMQGVKVKTLWAKEQPAGEHELQFDLSGLAPGVYFLNFRSGNNKVTKKLILAGR
jgi:hypothetical protein